MRINRGKLPLQTVSTLAHMPDLLRQGIRGFIRKRVTAHLDYWLRNGTSAPFAQIDMKIVNACNLRCKMCAQWGDAGWHLQKPNSFAGERVSLDVYRAMADQVAPFRPWICIWGGEPFLYPDLIPLVRYMKEKGLPVSISTNGTTLNRDGPALVEAGADVLMVSIDGPQETHNQIRGARSAYEKTVAGIQAVQAAKRRQGRQRPLLFIFATVSKDNVHNLDQVFELAQELGADGLVAYLGWFQTDASCDAWEEISRRKLDVIPLSPRGGIWQHDAIDTEILQETVRRIRTRSWSFAYVFAPDLDVEDIPRYYREHQNAFGYGKCVTPWTTVEIQPNGDVTTCRDYPDYVVGNITRESLTDIWNNEGYRRFRRVLKEERLFPICSRCCQLMGW